MTTEPSPKVLLLRDQDLQIGAQAGMDFAFFPLGRMPSQTDLESADLVIYAGPVQDPTRGLELAGTMKVVFKQGGTLVLLYNSHFENCDQDFVHILHSKLRSSQLSSVRPVAELPTPHPAFQEYLAVYGRTRLHFASFPDSAEPLAYAVVDASPHQVGPTAVHIQVDRGSLYVLPYAPPMDFGRLVERLFRAVAAHQEEHLVVVPSFFAGLEVPGEREVVGRITATKNELANLEQRHAGIVRHKHLLGHFSGTQLEELVIEDLNLVLADSGWRARDVEEEGAEDFEFVDASGTRTALAEAKAARGDVSLDHVNQVNSHRSEHFGATIEELPGLLVVSTFRNSDALDPRQRTVGERIVRQARAVNVLILRTWDLYQLVVRHLSGEDDGKEILAALRGGGGWLEAGEDGLQVHTGA